MAVAYFLKFLPIHAPVYVRVRTTYLLAYLYWKSAHSETAKYSYSPDNPNIRFFHFRKSVHKLWMTVCNNDLAMQNKSNYVCL